MKTALSLSLVAGLSLAASSAFAQDVASSVAPTPKFSLGAQIELLPAGETELSVDGDSESLDLATAYGVGATLDYAIHPNVSIGFAPRLVLGLKPDVDNADSSTEVDLRLRVKAQFPVAPKMSVYGYLAPGYSMVFLASNRAANGIEAEDPAGFVLAVGAGGAYDISDKLFATAELGYQAGFQTTELSLGAESTDADFTFSSFSVGVGLGTRF